jgi:hypothetical protein
MYHNGSDSTEWLEVMETPTYKRTMWLQEFAQGEFMEDSIDSVEITEFDDDVFTRSIRFFDRFFRGRLTQCHIQRADLRRNPPRRRPRRNRSWV